MHSRTAVPAGLIGLFALLGAGAVPAHGQMLSVVGKTGGYVPVSEMYEIPDAVGTLAVTKEADVAFGGAVELSPLFWPVDLRVGADYVTGLNVSSRSIEGEPVPADGSLLMLSGDLVWRPLPQLILVQPYLLGGIGYKQESFQVADGAGAALPDDYSDYVFHAGVGTDVALGAVDLVLEVSDYIGRADGGSASGSAEEAAPWRHDVFASVGLRFGLF